MIVQEATINSGQFEEREHAIMSNNAKANEPCEQRSDRPTITLQQLKEYLRIKARSEKAVKSRDVEKAMKCLDLSFAPLDEILGPDE